MKVQRTESRGRRGTPKRRWLDRVRDVSNCRGGTCTAVLHGGVRYRTSTRHKSGSKMKRKKRFISVNELSLINRTS